MQIMAGSSLLSSFDYSGPNQAQVAADNAKAVADGLNGGFSLADILTSKDKQLTGYDPNSGTINEAAIALANYRYNGSIAGDVTPQFVDALKTSIAATGGYPVNPAALLERAATSSPLSSDTVGVLLSMADPPNSPAAAPTRS